MSKWTLGQLGKQSQTNPNKAKSKKAKMNVTSILTKDYENISNWAICENEPKTNPTCRGVASGEAGTNPTCRGVASGEAGTNPTCRGVASGEAGSKPIFSLVCWSKLRESGE
jgi:hypothetical protein